MKILMECPNCHTEKVLEMSGILTSEKLKTLLDPNEYCEICMKNGLGKIKLNIKHFDWEKNAETIRRNGDKHTPTYLDPSGKKV